MSLVDDLQADTPELELTRRKALGLLTGGAFAVAGLGTAITTVRFMRPNVVFEPATKVPIGPPESLVVGELLVLLREKLYVLRTSAGVIAMTSVCTHLGCMTRYDKAAAKIACPCHGSNFDLGGEVSAGPAPRPLPRREVTLKDGQLIVDVRKEVDRDFVLEV